MKKLTALFLLASCVALSACGVKGPLYFPAPQSDSVNQSNQ